MADIIKIKKDGVVQYPITKPECVIDENGKNVLQLIRENAGGDPYDDTELRQEVAELSEEMASNGVLIEDLQNTKIDRENDDYYPKMAVGLADNLAGVDVVDSEINFRRSGGGAITDGVARIEAIKGNSVVWNQLANLSQYYTKTENGVTFVKNADGSISVSTDANGATADTYITAAITNLPLSHSVLLIGCPKGGSTTTYSIYNPWEGRSEVGEGLIYKNIAATAEARVLVKKGTIISSPIVFRPRYCDLTQMFQAGNEPTTIEEFNARKPLNIDEYAYNEGEVIHMGVQSIESVGVNQWDEEWEQGTIANATGENANDSSRIRSKNFIPIFPSTDYYCYYGEDAGSNHIYSYLYDKDKNLISAGSRISGKVFTTPPNAHYLRISNYGAAMTTYKGDICINLSDTAINGQYFPYIKRQEDLSIIHKYFPDGMKSAGSAHDAIRYNKTTQKREYSKGRMKEVDLGSLTFSEWQDGMYAANLADMAIKGQILCAKYSTDTYTNVTAKNTGIAALTDKGGIVIYDATYTTPSAIKTALQGVILYYEAAEWEWVELDKEDQLKDWDYSVWNDGTERANAEGKSAPLAADITYGFNAIGKIKELESLVAALRAKVGI